MIKILKTVKLIYLLLLLSIGISCNTNNSINYLKRVLSNLERIESATYSVQSEAWYPGDTLPYSVNCKFVHEYNNPMDSTIGASDICFDCDVTTKLKSGYDGKIKASINHDEKVIVLDDFSTRPLPFRTYSPPFFNYTKNIIQYALTTKDSISFDLKEFEEYYYFKLIINENKQVEFFGKAYHMPESPYISETTSIYEIWISKSNNLPYKLRREMSHQTSVKTISNIELNKLSITDFNIYDYFPIDYEIKEYKLNSIENKKLNLIGRKAPAWILNNKDEQSVSLSDFEGKILLLQLTGIGCGPCQVSIPFLKEIKEKYSGDSFELIAIETWKRKLHSLQYYSDKNELNYSLLIGTDDIVKDYQTGGLVPVFFILDREQIIRKVFRGYDEETAKKEIINAINELM